MSAGGGPVSRVDAVVVVAGGRSTRFGSDKLQHRLGGRTLLERTLDAAVGCGPVVLVTAGEVPAGVDVAVSENPRWGGPCAAIASALDALSGSGDALILPADLADPEAALAALLCVDEGVLTDQDGAPQWLLARGPIPALQARAAELRGAGALAGRPARDMLGMLHSRHPAPASACADIDTPADADAAGRIHPKEPAHGTV
ncbi:molybdenum cofactor guanylyltransferase [Leifsonia xyli]|uniref:molybdenum cofactor guanylyltransferase n=1 Tax=Leifsonia xyli TaxID=1575 RepID=UPI003D664340